MISQVKTSGGRALRGRATEGRSPVGDGEKPEALAAELDRLRRSCASLRGRNDQLQRKLCFANESKARFLGSVAHELRTPLGSLLILADLLAENRGGRLSAEEVEHARNIHRAGLDLREILDEVLELVRIEAGLVELRCEPVQLDGLLSELEGELRSEAEARGLELVVELHAGLPASITTDRHLVEQIVRTLLCNAMRSTPKGRLRVRCGWPGDSAGGARRKVLIEIEDQAPALPPEKWQAIFEPLAAPEARISRKHGGMGLELAIARQKAELLGGRLEMRATAGQGNTFALELPL